jgi:hypothetical protein
MQPCNSEYREQVAAIFQNAHFIQDLGLTLSDLGPGWCESRLAVSAPCRRTRGWAASPCGRPGGWTWRTWR